MDTIENPVVTSLQTNLYPNYGNTGCAVTHKPSSIVTMGARV